MSFNGWLNLYKPEGISSAKALFPIKKCFKNSKIGHTGTLDVEAEGVLPVAIGEATKLTNILMDAKKQYYFTIKFGAKTDTGDKSGNIVDKSEYFPTKEECKEICKKFIGKVEQIPPAYSAIKVNGKRAYDLARAGKDFTLKKRTIEIYDLKLVNYSAEKQQASYICECSKGTYIRTLAEDIALSLKSLGFVIKLCRLRVGKFDMESSIDISIMQDYSFVELGSVLQKKCLEIEFVLDGIPVLNAKNDQVNKIKNGQKCYFYDQPDLEFLWVKDQNNRIVAIGSLLACKFKSSRVFNL